MVWRWRRGCLTVLLGIGAIGLGSCAPPRSDDWYVLGPLRHGDASVGQWKFKGAFLYYMDSDHGPWSKVTKGASGWGAGDKPLESSKVSEVFRSLNQKRIADGIDSGRIETASTSDWMWRDGTFIDRDTKEVIVPVYSGMIPEVFQRGRWMEQSTGKSGPILWEPKEGEILFVRVSGITVAGVRSSGGPDKDASDIPVDVRLWLEGEKVPMHFLGIPGKSRLAPVGHLLVPEGAFLLLSPDGKGPEVEVRRDSGAPMATMKSP